MIVKIDFFYKRGPVFYKISYKWEFSIGRFLLFKWRIEIRDKKFQTQSVTAVIAGATASKFKLLLTHAASSHLLVRFCLRSHCKWRQSLLIFDDKQALEIQAHSWALHMTPLQSLLFSSTIWWLKTASLMVIYLPCAHEDDIFCQIAPSSCTWTKLMECTRCFQYHCYFVIVILRWLHLRLQLVYISALRPWLLPMLAILLQRRRSSTGKSKQHTLF